MRRRGRKHVTVTPAFLGARRRKIINDQTQGRVLPWPNTNVNSGELVQKGDIDNYEDSGLAPKPLPGLRREASLVNVMKSNRDSGTRMAERRAFSAPACQHMDSWVLPRRLYTHDMQQSLAGAREVRASFSKSRPSVVSSSHVLSANQTKRYACHGQKQEETNCPAMKCNSLPVLDNISLSRAGTLTRKLSMGEGKSRSGSRPTVRLLTDEDVTRKLKLNRTRAQTWHGLPVYPMKGNVINISSLYMRPHRALPHQFTIHPEWGMELS